MSGRSAARSSSREYDSTEASTHTVRLLLVEDNVGDADLVREHLEESSLSAEVHVTPRLSSALAIVAERSLDCVLLDLGLPDVRGPETVRRFREVAPNLPLVVLTGVNDEAIAGHCVTLGAQEYLEKAQLGPRSLAQAIELAMLRVSESRARHELHQTDRLRAVGLLAAGVAHEVNNPLTVLQFNLESLHDQISRVSLKPEARAPIEAELAECRDNSERIAAIVGRLNSFARTDTDRPRTLVRAAQVIQDARRLTEHRWRAHCKMELELEPGPPVLGYPGELTQVLVNLFLNAGQAIEAGGGSTIRVVSGLRGGVVEIQVSDDGPGMSPRVLSRVFDPFFTTKGRSQGTGLGLALCQDIVKGHGGSLEASSRVGGGSTFTLRLPPGPDGPPRIVPLQPASGVTARRCRILFIDDEPSLLRAVKRLLQSHHEVVVAESGAKGIRLLESGERFDTVFCDLTMPHPDGSEVHRWILEHRPALEGRFVLMSGGASDDVVSALGEMRRLAKPFDREELLETISEILERPLDA